TGLALGPSSISFRDLLALFSDSRDALHHGIIFQIRLPRVLAGILSGMALSVSGVVMQSVLRNPLGSPFTLGISNAAAFGAAFAIIIFGAGSMYSSSSDAVMIANPYVVTASAFVWSLGACFLILLVAKRRGATPENMILTGIIASSLFTALTTGLQYVADDVELATIVFWTFGDLSKGGWNELLLQVVIVVPVMVYFYRNRWNYNALDAGDETARSLGVNIGRLRLTGMVVASLATAAVVSFYGIIAFVGLVVPHMVRRITGGDERFLIPGAALAGAAFMTGCDIVARTLLSPVVLPVGILTSLIGAPLFVLLLIKGKGGSQWR
ncbi:MAG: iron ABC transporter permease, partial [Bacteroidales bacterium]|nr:iron ABC transporter permease [Bacteroidales bacterium]